MSFVILKSYDGGKHWEPERQFPDFATAAGTAQSLRAANPSIRFRVDVSAGAQQRAEPPRTSRRNLKEVSESP